MQSILSTQYWLPMALYLNHSCCDTALWAWLPYSRLRSSGTEHQLPHGRSANICSMLIVGDSASQNYGKKLELIPKHVRRCLDKVSGYVRNFFVQCYFVPESGRAIKLAWHFTAGLWFATVAWPHWIYPSSSANFGILSIFYFLIVVIINSLYVAKCKYWMWTAKLIKKN